MSSLPNPRDVPTQDTLPASQYLQEKLLERRARNTRPRRARHTDFGPRRGRDDDIFLNEAEESRGRVRVYDSSPLAIGSRLSDSGALDHVTPTGGSASSNRRRAPGIRDINEQLDRLNKQNFALKLELDHRREQTTKLHLQIDSMREKIERAEKLEEEHAELLRINSDLVEELEKRDRAVEEAMDIICDLEDKVAENECRGDGNTRPSTANADSGYAETDTQEQVPPSSPPRANHMPPPQTPYIHVRQPSVPTSSQRLQNVMASEALTPARPRREPNVLSQKKTSTNALRSVYLESSNQLHSVQSFHSLLSRRADEHTSPEDVLNSPRLSVLSESSFPSLYSPQKGLSPDRTPWEGSTPRQGSPIAGSNVDSRSYLRQDSIKRVSQWISERDVAQGTPSKSNHRSTPLADPEQVRRPIRSSTERTQFLSLDNALLAPKAPKRSSPIQSLEDSPSLISSSQARRERPRGKAPQARPNSFAGPIFGEPLLPPTPESASTRMLRASRSSIIDERSLLDTTPAAVKGFDVLEPGMRTAPRQMRSSVELKSAYASNLRYRHDSSSDSSSGGDDLTHLGDDDDTNTDAQSMMVRDFGLDYDGYPDGQSIIMGTPSRFLRHGKPSQPTTGVQLDGHDAFTPLPDSSRSPRSPTQRRRSSADIGLHNSSASLNRPRLSRLDTSPIFSSLGRMVSGGSGGSAGGGGAAAGGGAGGKTSVESVISPRSTHSGSSGVRTVVQDDAHAKRAISPDVMPSIPPTHHNMLMGSPSRTSASPARTLSQKTQNLFRRLSNSHGSDREKTPAPPPPISTTTPSGTVVHHSSESGGLDIKRPQTSNGFNNRVMGPAGSNSPHPPSSRDNRRPSMQFHRSKIDPALSSTPNISAPIAASSLSPNSFASPIFPAQNVASTADNLPPRSSSSTSSSTTTDKRNPLFRRSNSVRKEIDVDNAKSAHHPHNLRPRGMSSSAMVPGATASGAGITKRRGSLREAVVANATKKNWRAAG